jgi:hypothetical protein
MRLPKIVKHTGARGVTVPVVVVQLPLTQEHEAAFGSLTVTPLQVTVTCAIAGMLVANTAKTATDFFNLVLTCISISSDRCCKNLSLSAPKERSFVSPLGPFLLASFCFAYRFKPKRSTQAVIRMLLA